MKSVAGILRHQPGQRINSARTIQHQSLNLKQSSTFNPSATHGSTWTFQQKNDNNDIAEFESSQFNGQIPQKTMSQRL